MADQERATPAPAPDQGKAEKDGRSNPRRELLEAEILDKAERLFADRGFAGTNLSDVAEAMSLTRPALYYYFRSKEDLLAKVLARVSQDSVEKVEHVLAEAGPDVADRLRAIVVDWAMTHATHPDRFRMLVRSEGDLPAALAESYDDGRRRVLAVLTDVIDQGIRERRFRSVDSRVAALGIIGMCNWIPWWYRPGHRTSPEQVGVALADLAVASLLDPLADEHTDDSPQRALRRLEQDVEYLARVLGG